MKVEREAEKLASAILFVLIVLSFLLLPFAIYKGLFT